MKFLVVSTNTKDVSPYLSDEIRRIGELKEVGIFVTGWVKADFSGAVLVFECADRAEATAMVNTLPIAAHGATTFTLTEIADMDPATLDAA